MDVNVDGRCYSRDKESSSSNSDERPALIRPMSIDSSRKSHVKSTGSIGTNFDYPTYPSPIHRPPRLASRSSNMTNYGFFHNEFFVNICDTPKHTTLNDKKSLASDRSFGLERISENTLHQGSSMTKYLEQVNKNKRQILFFNGNFRTIWNILLIFINIYNMTWIPLRLSQMPETPHPLSASWIIDYGADTILLIDIIIRSFLFSVIMNHVEIFDSKLIYEKYTHSWGCVLDICAIIPFDLLAITLGEQYLPILRINRLMRLHRQKHHYEHFLSFIAEWAGVYLVFYFRIARIMCNFIYMTHLCACVWVCIGSVECIGWNWSESSPENMTECDTGWMSVDTPIPVDFWRKYFRAIYWGFVTLVTTGYGDIVPVTVFETCFLIVVMLIGMSLSTETIAIFTSIFAQGNVDQWEHEQRIEVLKSYMVSKQLPSNTIATVLDYFKYMWKTFKGVDERNILQSLPEHLRKEALTYLEGETIRRTPIFKDMDNAFVRSIAMVLDPIVFSPGKFIYRIGEPSTDMWFLNRGRVDILDSRSNLFKIRLAESCFGESALLDDKVREYNAKAITFCQLYKLSRENFDLVLKVLAENDHDMSKLRSNMKMQWEVRVRDRQLSRQLSANSTMALYNMRKPSRIPKYFFNISVFHPQSKFRYFWEVLNFVTVLSQMFIVIWRCAFQPSSPFHSASTYGWIPYDLLCDFIFYADFLLRSRCFGFVPLKEDSLDFRPEEEEKQAVVYDPHSIWREYRSGNVFWFDLISILPFDYMFCYPYPGSYAFLKLTRTLRWSRKDSWMQMFTQFLQKYEIGVANGWIRLLMFALQLIMVGHFMGCIWYLIGYAANGALNRDDYPEWEAIVADPQGALSVWFDYDELHTADTGRRYLRSLYWAFVTITTVGYGDIRAYTNAETLYAGICVFIGGMLYYSSVGHISSLLSRLTFMQKAHFEKGDRLERVMAKNHIPSDIKDRVRQYRRYAWEQQKGRSESEILKMLPQALKYEISSALNEKVLSRMPFFRDTGETFLKNLIYRFEYRVYLPNEWIFREGDLSFEFYIINSGFAALLTEEHLICYIREGEAVGAVEMYFRQNHTRSLQTRSFCHVSVMNAEDLNVVSKQYEDSRKTVEVNANMCMENEHREMKAIEANILQNKVQKTLIGEGANEGVSQHLIHPDSFFRNMWNFCILVIICYNAFDVPYSIAFIEDPDVTNPYIKLYMYSSFFFDVLFCFDVYFNAFKFTFEENGVLNMDANKIYERFKSQWWRSSCDIIAILPIDMFYFFITGKNNPILRINKICRSFRVDQLFTELRLWVQKTQIMNLSTQRILLVKLLFFMVMSAHLFACTFYFVGNHSRDLGTLTWIEIDFADGEHMSGLYDYTPILRYARSFYWALSTMTVVCFGDVVPQTDYTTCYVVIMMIIGFFVIANIIGNISDLLSRMDADVAILKEKLDLFDHYATSHDLPQKLADRVRMYLTHVYYSQKGVETMNVISELPKCLSNGISKYLYYSSIKDNPYFFFLESNIIMEICSAMILESFVASDIIIVEGAVPSSVSLLLSGRLLILEVGDMRQTGTIEPSSMVQDLEFFLGERMSSTLVAGDHTEMLTLHRKDYDRIFLHFPHHKDRMIRVAKKKFKRESGAHPEEKNSNLRVCPRSTIAKSFNNLKFRDGRGSFDLPGIRNKNRLFWQRIPTSSKLYQIWESIVLIVIFVEAAAIIFRACFMQSIQNWSFPYFVKSFIGEWLMDIILMADIYLHLFMFGFFKDGLEIEDDEKSMRLYLSGKFATNVLASFPIDLINLLLFDATKHKIMSTMIFCRLPKLLRLNDNLGDKFNQMEVLLTKTWNVCSVKWFRYLSYICFYLWMGHVVGCAWYFVGHYGRDHGIHTWLDRDSTFFHHNEDFVFTSYIRAIYFCLNAMTTTGYGDIIATNQFETIFLLCLIMLSTFMFSGMVGVMTSTMTGEIQSFATFERKLNRIRAYMKAKSLPTLLQRRILQYYAYTWEVKGINDECVVDSLPTGLQVDLGMYIRSPLLKAVSLFRACPLAVMRQLVLKLTPERYMPGDNIMRENEFGNGMYFIEQGVVKIVLADNKSDKYLYSGSYFGEEALVEFRKRTHSAFAASFCAIFTLNRYDLEEILTKYPEWRDEIFAFRSRLESLKNVKASDPCELFDHVVKTSETFAPKKNRMGSLYVMQFLKPKRSLKSLSVEPVDLLEQPDHPAMS